MADDNHRKPPWVTFLSGDEESQFCCRPVDPGRGSTRSTCVASTTAATGPRRALWTNISPRRGDGARRADKVRGHGRGRSVGAADADAGARAGRAIREARDHAPDDPAFFPRAPVALGFRGRINWRVVEAKWDGIRGVPRLRPGAGRRDAAAEIAAVEKRQPRDPQQGEDQGDGGERAGGPRHPRRVRQHPGPSRILPRRG